MIIEYCKLIQRGHFAVPLTTILLIRDRFHRPATTCNLSILLRRTSQPALLAITLLLNTSINNILRINTDSELKMDISQSVRIDEPVDPSSTAGKRSITEEEYEPSPTNKTAQHPLKVLSVSNTS